MPSNGLATTQNTLSIAYWTNTKQYAENHLKYHTATPYQPHTLVTTKQHPEDHLEYLRNRIEMPKQPNTVATTKHHAEDYFEYPRNRIAMS